MTLRNLYIFMNQRPTTFAVLVLLGTLAPAWVLTMDGGILEWLSL